MNRMPPPDKPFAAANPAIALPLQSSVTVGRVAEPGPFGDNSAAHLKSMKIVLVGRRNNRRVIHWPGVCAVALITVTLSILGYFAASYIFGLLGGAPPLLPGLLFAVILPLGCVLGVQMRRAWRLPLEQLSQLP